MKDQGSRQDISRPPHHIAAVILIGSILLYLFCLSSVLHYDNSHGGGQDTLTGASSSVILILTGLFSVFALFQLGIYRVIKKRTNRMPLYFILQCIPTLITLFFFIILNIGD